MKKKILIISGGISKERAISLDTGKQVAKELANNSYIVKITEPNFKLIETIKSYKPNIIFNALHGQFGEDGYVQTILETTKIPYTHSGVNSSALAMDKELSKKIFIKNKILTPNYIIYNYDKGLCPVTENMYYKEMILSPIVREPLEIVDMNDLIAAIKKVISNKEIIAEKLMINNSDEIYTPVDAASSKEVR